MRRNHLLPFAALLIFFALGWVESPKVLTLLHRGPVHVLAHAQWASAAGTVAQQAGQADLIVRARVHKVFRPKVFERRLANPSDRLPAKFDVLPFTYVLLKVETVYRGEVEGNLRLVQTGGKVEATANHPALEIALYDDPLLVEGSEHIFFLKNISGDPMLAPHHKVYRIINSAGRYDIQGGTVVSHSDIPGQRPLLLKDLDAQIRLSL
ncbi:MAG: hypothetical protein M3O15_01780 [Acidobacteriota bacterium]|nr:hypothetical protein [Acidobacteriota bacterium]